MFKKLYLAVLLFSSIFFIPLKAIDFPSLIENISGTHFQESSKEQPAVPDPYHLQPQWWHYFDASEEEIPLRVTEATNYLEALYNNLSLDDQRIALPLIHSLTKNLKALSEARSKKLSFPHVFKTFNKAYTIEQQLHLQKQKRYTLLEIKKNQEELKDLKDRIASGQKSVDSRLAIYLGVSPNPTRQRLLSGLEIMAQRAATGIAEENLRVLKIEIENQQAALASLEQELEVAGTTFDVSIYDENQLNRDIQKAQQDFEKKHMESVKAAYTIEIREIGLQGRSVKNLMLQKATESAVDEALAWTRLAFSKLKFMLVMHANNRYPVTNDEMHHTVFALKDRLNRIAYQQPHWEKLTELEQERIRKDQSLYPIEQGPGPGAHDPVAIDIAQLNKERHSTTLQTLSLLHLLSEEKENVQWLIAQLEHKVRAHSFFPIRWWAKASDYLASLQLTIRRELNMSLFKIYEFPVTLLTLIKIITIILATFITSSTLRFLIRRLNRQKLLLKESIVNKIETILHYLVLFIGGIFILYSIGMDLNHVMILLGALTLGIGFGLQSVAMNFLSGLKILFDKNINVGDYIELKTGRAGKVTEIHIQNTLIRTSDGVEIVIPNSELLSAPLVNWTMNDDYIRMHIPFSVSCSSSKDKVRTIVSEAAKKVPCTVYNHYRLKDPEVWMIKFSENSLDFELVVWVDFNAKSFSDSKDSDYLWTIETALRENKIALPLSQQFFYVRNPPNSSPASSPNSPYLQVD